MEEETCIHPSIATLEQLLMWLRLFCNKIFAEARWIEYTAGEAGTQAETLDCLPPCSFGPFSVPLTPGNVCFHAGQDAKEICSFSLW